MSANVLALAAVAAQMFLVVRAAQAGEFVSVPEPTTMALLGAGAAVAAVGAWWKNRK